MARSDRIGGAAMPWLRSGLAVGILIALIDGLSTVAGRDLPPDSATAQYIAAADQFANVVLFSVLGYRVGRATRLPRAAAEAGVLAGAIAGIVAIAVMAAFPNGLINPGPREMIGTLALNVAMGGVLSLVNGWIGSRAEDGRRDRRP